MWPYGMDSILRRWKRRLKKSRPTTTDLESVRLPLTVSVHNYAMRQRYLTLLRKVENLGRTTNKVDDLPGYTVTEERGPGTAPTLPDR